MISEIHLFILWSKAYPQKKRIINDINDNFVIIKEIEIFWDKRWFPRNLTRFYGTKLPRFSFKERHCGTGPFTLVVVRDDSPQYGLRKTSKGEKYVNIKMFDRKDIYRSWTGGGHKIHGTNDVSETAHDLSLLLGYTPDDFLHHINDFGPSIHRNLTGNEGWNSLRELFYLLNATINYVVLRNYEYLPDFSKSDTHSDIDILVNNSTDCVYICNAKKVLKKKYRVHYKTMVNNDIVYFDFRFWGDNYYDERWERAILESKELNNNNIYIPDYENYRYSLAYHAMIHKSKVSDEYNKKLSVLFSGKAIDDILKELILYLREKNYNIVEPSDFSVFYKNILNTDISFKRKLYNLVAASKNMMISGLGELVAGGRGDGK